MVFVDGSKFEGDWDNGLKHGYGVYKHANGDEYAGEYKLDKREGKGTYMHVSG